MNSVIEKYIFDDIKWIVDKCFYYHKPVMLYDEDVLIEIKVSLEDNYEHYSNKKYNTKSYGGFGAFISIDDYLSYFLIKLNTIYGLDTEKTVYYINEFFKNMKWKDYE